MSAHARVGVLCVEQLERRLVLGRELQRAAQDLGRGRGLARVVLQPRRPHQEVEPPVDVALERLAARGGH